MTAIAFSRSGLRNAKRALVANFPNQKSSHLTEALAAACGYQSNAALLSALGQSDQTDPDYVLLDDAVFVHRLRTLGGSHPSRLTFDGFQRLRFPSAQEVVKTESAHGRMFRYRSNRVRAWRNALVAGINAGIEQRLFTIRPGDNRWPGASATVDARGDGHVFSFVVQSIPGLGWVSDAGFDELAVHVALWPKPGGELWIQASNAGFYAGELFASGWLERRDGAWLQTSGGRPSLSCRKSKLLTTATLNIPSTGYADRGDFKM